jgi:hypothetical protein
MTGRAVLTEDAVRTIRSEIAAGTSTVAKLSIRYDVGTNAIYDVVKGQTWRHVLPFDYPTEGS